MNKLLTLLTLLFFFTFAFSQEEQMPKTKEKAPKEKESKDSEERNKKKRDDADVFIGEPEDSEDYQLDNRREISKPSMPYLDVDQEFNSQKKKAKQQKAFNDNDYFFPAKPKNAWSIGINGGVSSVNGDVSSNFFRGAKPFLPGYTFGAYVKKPFSYLFSMRLHYRFMEMWNTDFKSSTLTENLIRNTDYQLVEYITDNPYGLSDLIYHNSHTVSHDLTLDAIFTFGNVKFHKERSKVVFNAFLSGGAFMYRTWMDHLDDNGLPYDYRSIPNLSDAGVSKKDVLSALQEMRNGVYGTAAEGHPDTKNPSLLGGYSMRPVFGGGFGITFRVNRFIDIDLETRIMFTRDDLVEGHRWQEPSGNSLVNLPGNQFQASGSAGMTRDYDSYMTTTLGLNFKLVGKKKTEPTTLLNPMHYTYAKLAEADPDKILNELMKDSDGDGVPDLWDEEPDTPEGAPVDPKGRALDSDGDGIIDLYDLEPFSPPGYPVDENGVAIKPESPGSALARSLCNDIETFPSIHFDKDKYYIVPEFFAHIHIIAEKMLLCDDLKLIATGTADIDHYAKYNMQLSWNRVNKIISFITETYGISRERFLINYVGETESTFTRAFPLEQYLERKVYFKVVDENTKGSSTEEAPYPDIKAGTDKF